MITIGPTRWFAQATRVQERGGRTKYDLRLLPEADKDLITKLIYEGLHERVVEAELFPEDISVTAWLNTWEACGADELRFCKSLCEELAAQAVGEGMRLHIFRPEGLEKYVRQLVVSEGLLKAIQRPNETAVFVEEIDVREDLREAIDAKRFAAERAVQAAQELHEREHKYSAESRKRSMELLYDNLPEGLVKEAKEYHKITIITEKGERFIVPLMTHGMVERYNKDGVYIGKYCLLFAEHSMPVGDEVLMKMILIKSDLKTFIKKANFFAGRS